MSVLSVNVLGANSDKINAARTEAEAVNLAFGQILTTVQDDSNSMFTNSEHGGYESFFGGNEQDAAQANVDASSSEEVKSQDATTQRESDEAVIKSGEPVAFGGGDGLGGFRYGEAKKALSESNNQSGNGVAERTGENGVNGGKAVAAKPETTVEGSQTAKSEAKVTADSEGKTGQQAESKSEAQSSASKPTAEKSNSDTAGKQNGNASNKGDAGNQQAQLRQGQTPVQTQSGKGEAAQPQTASPTPANADSAGGQEVKQAESNVERQSQAKDLTAEAQTKLTTKTDVRTDDSGRSEAKANQADQNRSAADYTQQRADNREAREDAQSRSDARSDRGQQQARVEQQVDAKAQFQQEAANAEQAKQVTNQAASKQGKAAQGGVRVDGNVTNVQVERNGGGEGEQQQQAAQTTKASATAKSGGTGSGEAASNSQKTLNEAEQSQVAKSAIRGLKSVINQRGGRITLQLNPKELGALKVQVQMRNGVVQANFEASSESVKQMLQQQVGHLKQALESQGLTVERINVQVSPNANNGQQAAADQSGNDGPSRGFYEENAGQHRQDAESGREDATASQGDEKAVAARAQAEFGRELLDLVV